MPKDLAWLEKIEWEDLLTEDMKIVKNNCGKDVLLELIKHLSGIPILISGALIKKARRRYIQRFYNGENIKQLCLECGAPVRFGYMVVNEMNKQKIAAEGGKKIAGKR